MFMPHSAAGREAGSMRALVLAVIVLATAAARAEPVRDNVCFSPRETRVKVAQLGLVEPLRLLKSSAGRLQAEVVGAKLCRQHDEWIYEVSLLRRDGHIVHLRLNATSGLTIGPHGE